MARHIISIGEAKSAVDYLNLKERVIASSSDSVRKENKSLFLVGEKYRVVRSDKYECRMTESLDEAVEWYNYGW